MGLVVPYSQSRAMPSAIGPTPPSPVMLAIAAAHMHEQGRLFEPIQVAQAEQEQAPAVDYETLSKEDKAGWDKTWSKAERYEGDPQEARKKYGKDVETSFTKDLMFIREKKKAEEVPMS